MEFQKDNTNVLKQDKGQMTIILFCLLFVCAVSLTTKVSFPTTTDTTLETCPWVQATDAEFDQYLAIGSIDILMGWGLSLVQ